MKCIEVKSLVAKQLVGELTAGESRLLNQHLSECRACSQQFNPLLKVNSALNTLPSKPLPPGFDLRFSAKLARKTSLQTLDWPHKMSLHIMTSKWRLPTVLVFSLLMAGMARFLASASMNAFDTDLPHNILMTYGCALMLVFLSYLIKQIIFEDTISKLRRNLS